MGDGLLPLEEAARALLGEVAQPTLRSDQALVFQPILETTRKTRAAAVDGGQSVVAELGSCGVVAVRAGFTLRDASDQCQDHVTWNRIRLVVKRKAASQWTEEVAPYARNNPSSPPAVLGPQWVRSWCDEERTVAECEAATKALRRLESGDLLLWDGSLDAETPHGQLLEDVLGQARSRGVVVVGVTKDTSLTLGGVFPFTLELEELAQRRQIAGPFWVDVTEAWEGSHSHRTYGVRWDAYAPVFRVDVASDDSMSDSEILSCMGSLCNDVAFVGYPYPLARIHQKIHFSEQDSTDLKRQMESLIAERKGSLFSLRIFGRGRDVLALGV